MTEGKTPSATPKTRTVSDTFYVGYDLTGTVGYGDESWPAVNGVVHCPLEVGEPNGWARASDEQRAAYEKAVNGANDEAAKKKAEEEAAAKKKAEEEAVAKKKVEEEAAAKK